MKHLLSLFFLIVLSIAQAQGEVELENIRLAMQSSSSKELIKYCAENVEINIDGVENSYNVPQAEVVFKDFFSENPATSFAYIHQGSSPEGLIYTIGQYEVKNGNYRVVMFIKNDSGAYRIDTITLSRE